VDTAPADTVPPDTALLGRVWLDREPERCPQRLRAGPGGQIEGFGSRGAPLRDYMSELREFAVQSKYSFFFAGARAVLLTL
jgi:hypothetical protein